ncbi:MAG: hypothetical protein VYA67_16780 [Actinomycetota bacterium]|nr:hypothetical protein [Actinomycetota bacterium]
MHPAIGPDSHPSDRHLASNLWYAPFGRRTCFATVTYPDFCPFALVKKSTRTQSMTPNAFVHEVELLGDIYVIHEVGTRRIHLIGSADEIEQALSLPPTRGAVRSRLLEVFETADQLRDAATDLENQAPLPEGPAIANLLRRVADSLVG